MNASVAIQSLPKADNNEELIRIVDEVIAYIKSTGLNYYVGPSVSYTHLDVYKRQPHYNYVGDSILGYKAHMGAGSITSNVKSDKTLVMVHAEEGDQETGLKKFGAMLGDGVEVGCNSVLNPGTVIGRNTNVYPLSSVRGCVPANSIYKAKDCLLYTSPHGGRVREV